MNFELETTNVVAMNAFRPQLSESDLSDDPLEVLLREANISDEEALEEAIEDKSYGLNTLAILNMNEDELSLHLEGQIAGLREGISRLKFYLTDVHEAINGL